MIDWRPMTEWPPRKQAHSDQFLFWYPATADGRTVRSADATVGMRGGARTPIRWAEIDPPKSDDEASRDRLLAALALLGGSYFLENFFWGPRHEAERAAVLSALTGSKVPKSRAGFNAFREALYAALGVEPGTPNARANDFASRAAKAAGEAGVGP